MEHCDHGSLHAAIQRGIFKPTSRWGAKLALRALIRTVREVAQGMFHLHSNNVLHGDLKVRGRGRGGRGGGGGGGGGEGRGGGGRGREGSGCDAACHDLMHEAPSGAPYRCQPLHPSTAPFPPSRPLSLPPSPLPPAAARQRAADQQPQGPARLRGQGVRLWAGAVLWRRAGTHQQRALGHGESGRAGRGGAGRGGAVEGGDGPKAGVWHRP